MQETKKLLVVISARVSQKFRKQMLPQKRLRLGRGSDPETAVALTHRASNFRFKRFDNKFIRPYLLRHYQGAEPKILETYSKLAMRDAMEYMHRNASTIGNISGTESMSAIFRNYTAGNLNGRCAPKLITW